MKKSRIKRVQKVKKVNNLTLTRKAKNLIKVTKQNRGVHTSRLNNLSVVEIYERLEALKSLSKAKGLTLKDSLKYVSKERIKRMKTQLNVFYIAKIDKLGTMRFSVKSSGRYAPKAYYVDIRFKKLLDAVRANPNGSIKDIILPLRFRTQCTCDDFRYRFAYWHTLFNTILYKKEFRHTRITNASGEHLFLCKHQALVFSRIIESNFKAPYLQQIIKDTKDKAKDKALKKAKKDRIENLNKR